MKIIDTPFANTAELQKMLVATGRISAHAHLTEFTGGVSSLAALVVDRDDEWVVKSPLRRLSVDDVWIASRERGANEAAILEFLDGRLGPIRVPRLRFFDSTHIILGEEFILGPPPTYKDLLLCGAPQPEVAAALGIAITHLHSQEPPERLAGDGPRQLFRELRLEAYYETTAQQLDQQSDALYTLIHDTLAAQRTLVHGDLTPKNVLVAPSGPVLVDWEVIHLGDPAFDLGTVIAHLILKAIREPSMSTTKLIVDDARQFLSSYNGPADRRRAFRHAGAIMLARLFGKSRVEYLSEEGLRVEAQKVGVMALQDDNWDLENLEEVMVNPSDDRDLS